MIFLKGERGSLDKTIRVEDHFALFPLKIERPRKGLLWGEFYGKVYEYYNGAWHFMGKLHREFEAATFENNKGEIKTISWKYPDIPHRIWFFTRWILVFLFWITLILGVVLLVHKYL